MIISQFLFQPNVLLINELILNMFLTIKCNYKELKHMMCHK